MPEVKELIAFLQSEADKLYTLEGLGDFDTRERQVKLDGKMWAYNTISNMLAPLLQSVDNPVGTNPEDYRV